MTHGIANDVIGNYEMNEFKATDKWYKDAAENETGHDISAGLIDDHARSSGLFMCQTIENYLKKRIDNGDDIRDFSQDCDASGMNFKIFHKDKLVSTFKFISHIEQKEDGRFFYNTDCYHKEYA
jgi:hypothetical protein